MNTASLHLTRSAASIAAACTLALASHAAQAVTLAAWTFETTQPTTAGPHNAEVGTGQASGFHASSAAVYSSPVGNGSAKSFSSNNWAVGDYYQFSASTTGYTGITVSWDQISSSTGPYSFELDYSTDGVNFGWFAYYSVNINAAPFTWTSGTPSSGISYSYPLSTVPALNNAATVYFRLIDRNTTATGGGTVASAGTSRVDNFTIGGSPISAVPQPPTAALLLGGLGLVAWRLRSGKTRR